MTFPDFCRQLGIIPPETIIWGRWYSCATEAKPRSKSASVKICADGRAGFANDHASMTEAAVWRESDGKKVSRDLGAENAERSARIQMRAKEEAEGTRRALKLWDSAQPLRHAAIPYMERKRVTMNGGYGFRIIGESLLIPMWRDGEIISIQRIESDGSKKFAAGAPSKGAYFWIDRKGAVATIIAEGFATALTVFESVANSRVCVTFSAANMIEVAMKLDWHGLTCIASDNDHEKPCPWCLKQGEHLQNPPNQKRPSECRCNTGYTSALAAAKVIKCGVAIPPAADGITDFNDYFCQLLAVKESIAQTLRRPPQPHALRSSALLPISSLIKSSLSYIP